MPDIVSGVMAGVSLLNAGEQGNAAQGAAAVQSGTSAEQIAEFRRQFDAFQRIMSPYTSTGVDALNQSRQLLGLGALSPAASGGAGSQSYNDIRNRLIGQYTTNTPGTMPQLPVGVNAVAGAKDGQQGYWVDNNEGGSTFTPMVGGAAGGPTIDESGLEAAIQAELAAQQAGQPSLGTADEQQAAAVAKFENSPYFQAIVRQSEDAMLQNASATGGLRGGNTQDALSKNRPILLQQLIDKQLANLGGLTSLGQSSAAGVGQAGLTTGQLVGGGLGTQGAAQAGGILGQSNANIGALGTIGGLFGAKTAGTNPFGNIGSIIKYSGTSYNPSAPNYENSMDRGVFL